MTPKSAYIGQYEADSTPIWGLEIKFPICNSPSPIWGKKFWKEEEKHDKKNTVMDAPSLPFICPFWEQKVSVESCIRFWYALIS